MSSLAENITQAINDFDSIKQAIEDKGVTVGNAKTSEYAGKIGEIQTGQEVMFSADGRCYVTDIVFSDNVTSIGNYAFNNCSDIVSVAIGNNVTSIGSYAFSKCTNLKNVAISNSVTAIFDNAFQGSLNITNITLEAGFNAPLTLSSWWGTIQLTADVMVAMFEALADLTGQTAKTLALGAKNLAKLTDAQKQIATNKNWNLA